MISINIQRECENVSFPIHSSLFNYFFEGFVLQLKKKTNTKFGRNVLAESLVFNFWCKIMLFLDLKMPTAFTYVVQNNLYSLYSYFKIYINVKIVEFIFVKLSIHMQGYCISEYFFIYINFLALKSVKPWLFTLVPVRKLFILSLYQKWFAMVTSIVISKIEETI